jgi:ABC-2 type transport system permease protein
MRLFSILKKDLQILTRSRAEMLVLFLMPLAFIIPVSFALGAGDGYGIRRDNQMMRLPVVNLDGGPHAQVLMSAVGESLRLEFNFGGNMIQRLALGSDPDCAPVLLQSVSGEEAEGTAACDEKVARAMLQRSWRPAALIIPPGFSDAVSAGEQVQVELLYDPVGDSIAMQQVEGVVKGATIKVSLQNQVGRGLSQLNDLAILAPPEVRQSVSEQSVQPPARRDPAIRLVKRAPENYQENRTPDTYQQTIPGYTVMFVFFIVTTMSASIRQEKVHGTFRRLLSTPVSRAELLGGKMLATMLVGLGQVLLLFLVGAVFFRLGLGKDPLAFLLLTIVLVATAASIGLAISASRGRLAGVGAMLIIAAALGGCLFPLDLMPPFLRSLSYFVPHSWALMGYQNLMVRGQGLPEVLPQIGALMAFALLFFAFAVRRFEFED